MKSRGRVLAGLVCGLWCAWFSGACAVSPAKPAFDTAPARAALQRLLPQREMQFTLVALGGGQGADRFRIGGTPGHIVVAGTSPAVILTGVETYLERVAHVAIGWPGDSLARLPATLPAPAAPIVSRAVVPDRYALNDTDDGYSNAYLGWPAWAHKIDLLALHGIDEVFIPVGTEEVYRRTFRDFGYSDAEMRAWIPAPAHQPWWLLQNISGFDAPVSPRQYARRVALAKKIVARLRALGMAPVFPGYFGTVPPGFAAKHPGADVVPQGLWAGFVRPDWLDPRDPLYAKVAADFYRRQRALFGASTMYKMDLLHEGGRAGDVPVAAAARGVMAALQAAHPGARWVLLGWQHNPLPAVIDAVDRQRLLIVDGLSDRYDGLDREKDWHGTPYAFGSIPNFGGHSSLGANAGVWLKRFVAWRGKLGSKLRGIAWMPEASGIDPAAFALFTSLAWEPVPHDEATWFKAYADSRYGGIDTHAEDAWRILGETAYAMPSNGESEPQDSLFEARPSQDVATAASWSPRAMRYDAEHFERAICELLQVAPALRATSAYRHDVVDVARQTLANRTRVLLPRIREAYAAKDVVRLHALDTEWLDDMALLDRLLASDPRFLLGRWLAPAQAAADNTAEAAQFEYDQRALITIWGDRGGADHGGLHDYANRELSGLVSGLYEPRWRRYFESLEQSLAKGKPPKEIDWYAMEHAWAVSREAEPDVPQGDPWSLAAEVTRRLGICRP
uniref:alpha-N-acetylglucosaminidase n=1 Tax=Rhodanobacter glycinis TaxID=582702 RepID=UPI00209BDE38|nr:alpha-N-acetylglucosaminidase [Rhodanobacter glycinis]